MLKDHKFSCRCSCKDRKGLQCSISCKRQILRRMKKRRRKRKMKKKEMKKTKMTSLILKVETSQLLTQKINLSHQNKTLHSKT